jgi:hypothetical protein
MFRSFRHGEIEILTARARVDLQSEGLHRGVAVARRANTTIHYRAVVTSDFATLDGADKTLVTGDAPTYRARNPSRAPAGRHHPLRAKPRRTLVIVGSRTATVGAGHLRRLSGEVSRARVGLTLKYDPPPQGI